MKVRIGKATAADLDRRGIWPGATPGIHELTRAQAAELLSEAECQIDPDGPLHAGAYDFGMRQAYTALAWQLQQKGISFSDAAPGTKLPAGNPEPEADIDAILAMWGPTEN